MALTKSDFENIKEIVKMALSEDETLVRKEDIKHLPNKEEFFDSQDKLIGELKANREEMAILSGLHRKINNHEQRIEYIEEALDIQPAI
ncbi:MAG TPA: hypothetical protein VL401_01225 [Alphaproteobacteria bacterium]|jgi:hypothetical protein|nr:hypothetical protein [Alphaproteobacteria bacterium]